MKKENLCIVAGGSGGHILPALVLAKQWKEQNKDKKVLFFGNKKKLDQTILRDNEFLDTAKFFKLINFPGKKLWFLPKFSFQFLNSFFKSLYFLRKYKIKKIIGTGGYLAIPACFAGKVLRCEIELYELNVKPGKAIKFLSPLANKIFITFEKSKEYLPKIQNKCFLKNYPLRFSKKDKMFNKAELIEKINNKFFTQNKKTIFLLGGSKGSKFLNETFKSWINNNKNLWRKIQIIHQTGFDDLQNIKDFYSEKNIPAIVFSFEKNIKDFYLISDLVISRAGAGTIFELEFFQKNSVLIPLQTKHTNHQVFNAKEIATRNADRIIVLEQNQIKQNLNLLTRQLGLFLQC